MAKDATMKMALEFRPGRTNDENWEETYPSDISFWENAIPLISNREYNHGSHKITINADWTPVINILKKLHKFLLDLHSGEADSANIFADTANIPISIEIHGKINTVILNFLPAFLEYYTHEIFITMNLARPGSCDFYNLRIINKNPHYHEIFHNKEVRISSYNFEHAWTQSAKHQFPKLQEMPLEKVMEWYEKINFGTKQKATKPIEKIIFSMLHICRSEGDLPSVAWIFHALESLFSTRVGEGFTNLTRRISTVLDLDKKQESILRKNLRALYDMRNALLHGGYDIYHPMRNEAIDKSIDYQYMEIYENLHFGVATIACCLQNLISKGWYGIEVNEIISGKSC